jgi:hypothetical protein
MSNDKSHLHPDLYDASLEKACKMANDLTHTAHKSRTTVESDAADLHYMLEYLRLNFDLVPKK